MARIELTRRNAAVLEAKAAGERARLLAMRTVRAVHSPEVPSQVTTQPTEERVDAATVSNQELRERFAKEQTRKLQKDADLWKADKDGAESWTPGVAGRRG